MRHLHYFLAVLGFALGSILAADSPVSSGTITFSSALNDILKDHEKSNLGDSFTFALGVFTIPPNAENTGDWINNFVPFFEADFRNTNPDVPRFGVEAEFMSDGSSSALPGSSASLPATGFSGMEAWLWVYNGANIADPGTEWFLGRADDWVFPTVPLNPDPCDDCPGSFPIQWAVSDLFGTTPVWGQSRGNDGSGFKDPDIMASLQTAIIPEPRTWIFVLGLLSIFVFHTRLRRPQS